MKNGTRITLSLLCASALALGTAGCARSGPAPSAPPQDTSTWAADPAPAATPAPAPTPAPAATPAPAPTQAPADIGPAYIGEDAAEAAALADAGVTADQAGHISRKLDYDDGRAEYEIEFYADGVEYEYDIDALTGAILSRQQERESR